MGWEYVHVCIDDASRVAYVEIKKSERKASAIAFLKAAVVYYAKLGVRVQRVMTDNGACYKSRAFGRACKRLGLKHIRTRPYTPKNSRVGLCQGLPPLRSPRRRTSALAPSLQLAPSPWQYRRQTAHQQTRPNREQPVEAPQLEHPPRNDPKNPKAASSEAAAMNADSIQYALETDWPVGAAGFEPLHIRIGICQDSQLGGRDSNLRISN